MPTDRIDQMTHEELKAATRRVLKAWDEYPECGQSAEDEFHKAIREFRPTTLDKVRELLKAENYSWDQTYGGSTCGDFEVHIFNRTGVWERWIPTSRMRTP